MRLEDEAPRRGVPTAVIVAGVFALVGLGLGVVLLGLAFALWFPTNSPPAARVAPPAVPMANPPAPVAQPHRVQEWKEPPGAPQEVKPPAPEPKKVEPPPPPPRPRFGDEHAYRESLAKGRVYMEVWIRDADPADRDGQTPARIVLVDLEAPGGYLAELTWSAAFNLDRHRIPGLRLENLRGEELAVGSQTPDKGRVIKLFYQPAKTEPHRFVVTVEPDAVHVPFTFTVRAATHADILPEVSRTKPRALPSCPPIRLVGKAGPYLTGALSPDGKTAWFVDVNRGLYCRGLPDLADRGTYKIDSHPYQFVFVKADRLYALCERDLAPMSVNTDRPDHERGIASLRFYDPSSPPAKGQLLLTRESASVETKVSRLLLSQDGKFYYYLDTAVNAVHKRTTEAYMFIKAPAEKIKKGTTALALSPDGKTLYTCGSGNFIEQIDTETMQIKKTIRLTHGKPTALVATDSGYLFLKPSSPGDEKSILLVNANPDYGDKEVFPLVWSSHEGRPSSFLLSRDQRWLYVHESVGGQARLGAYHVADWPGIDRGQLGGELRDGSLNTRGRLALSRDGNYLLIDKGLLLSVGP